MINHKPVVMYDGNEDSFIEEGYRAIVYPWNHPHTSNDGHVQTTPVIRHNKETGEFETQNTIYVCIYGD